MDRRADRHSLLHCVRWLTCGLIIALAALSSAAQSMRCESPDGSYRECRIGASGRVRLVLEISNRRCYEDLTWGTVSNGVVWVSGACSALFKVETGSLGRGGSGQRVVCESRTGKLELCRADGSRGVELARQLGTSLCIEHESWGHSDERDQIWVDHGCRGEFVLGRLLGPPEPVEPLTGRVVCESTGKKRIECAADTAAGAQIVRELDDKPCRFDCEWGFEPSKIWVSRGCRAEFAVRGRPTLSTVVCESEGEARVRCPADTKLGVALVASLHDTQCALGTTWGFDEEGVWVAAGCRAKFALGGYRISEAAVPATATRVVCESSTADRNRCPVDASHGVALVRQLGDSACVLNSTWGYDRDGIWVSDGCRGDFAVAP